MQRQSHVTHRYEGKFKDWFCCGYGKLLIHDDYLDNVYFIAEILSRVIWKGRVFTLIIILIAGVAPPFVY
jgi:hypothetical protein